MTNTGRRMSAEARALLAAALGEGGPALPFAESVVLQIAGRPGAPADPEAELACARRLVGMLSGSPDERSSDAALTLARDPVLLAAFFQNVDLLYEHRDPGADTIAAWVMDALTLAAAGEER